jgi:hypothetical protein
MKIGYINNIVESIMKVKYLSLVLLSSLVSMNSSHCMDAGNKDPKDLLDSVVKASLSDVSAQSTKNKLAMFQANVKANPEPVTPKKQPAATKRALTFQSPNKVPILDKSTETEPSKVDSVAEETKQNDISANKAAVIAKMKAKDEETAKARYQEEAAKAQRHADKIKAKYDAETAKNKKEADAAKAKSEEEQAEHKRMMDDCTSQTEKLRLENEESQRRIEELKASLGQFALDPSMPLLDVAQVEAFAKQVEEQRQTVAELTQKADLEAKHLEEEIKRQEADFQKESAEAEVAHAKILEKIQRDGEAEFKKIDEAHKAELAKIEAGRIAEEAKLQLEQVKTHSAAVKSVAELQKEAEAIAKAETEAQALKKPIEVKEPVITQVFDINSKFTSKRTSLTIGSTQYALTNQYDSIGRPTELLSVQMIGWDKKLEFHSIPQGYYSKTLSPEEYAKYKGEYCLDDHSYYSDLKSWLSQQGEYRNFLKTLAPDEHRDFCSKYDLQEYQVVYGYGQNNSSPVAPMAAQSSGSFGFAFPVTGQYSNTYSPAQSPYTPVSPAYTPQSPVVSSINWLGMSPVANQGGMSTGSQSLTPLQTPTTPSISVSSPEPVVTTPTKPMDTKAKMAALLAKRQVTSTGLTTPEKPVVVAIASTISEATTPSSAIEENKPAVVAVVTDTKDADIKETVVSSVKESVVEAPSTPDTKPATSSTPLSTKDKMAALMAKKAAAAAAKAEGNK